MTVSLEDVPKSGMMELKWWRFSIHTGRLRVTVDEYDLLIQSMLDPATFRADILEPQLVAIKELADLLARQTEGTPQYGEIRQALKLAKKVGEVLASMAAVIGRLHERLGDAALPLIRALSIGKRTRGKAFESATRKLERKRDNEKFNYLVRRPKMRGVDQALARVMIREDKVSAGEDRHDPDYGAVARFVANPDDPDEPVIVTLLDPNDKYAVKACANIREMVLEDVENASSTMFKTAIDHLRQQLKEIPLTTNHQDYACPADKTCLVELVRELVTWVGLRYRHPDADPRTKCECIVQPMYDTQISRELVEESAKAHLQEKLEVLVGQMLDLEKRREAGEEVPDTAANIIRKEVLVVRDMLQTYQAELATTASVFDKRTKLLMAHYKKFVGLA